MLGRYVVSVNLEGFKKAVSSEILLQGGDSFRQDVSLQVGALSETVEVKSTSAWQTSCGFPRPSTTRGAS